MEMDPASGVWPGTRDAASVRSSSQHLIGAFCGRTSSLQVMQLWVTVESHTAGAYRPILTVTQT